MANKSIKFITDFLNTQFKEGAVTQEAIDAWSSKETQAGFKRSMPRHKKRKDPNAPRGPRSTFILYGQDERANVTEEDITAVMEEFPDLKTKAAATGKVLGARWKNIDAKQKKMYEVKAAADKKRWETEMSGYERPAHLDSHVELKTKVKGTRSAFAFFKMEMTKEIKKDNPKMTIGELTKEANTQWKILKEEDPEEAARFTRMAEEDKLRNARETINTPDVKSDSESDYSPNDDAEHTLESLLALSKESLVKLAKESGTTTKGSKAVIAAALLDA